MRTATESNDGLSVDNLSRFPAMIVFASMTFNMFLCFFNTHLFNVSVPLIMISEVVLISAAVCYGFYRIEKLKLFWLVILIVQILLISVLSHAKQEVLLKPLRDMMIVPVFIVLGLSAHRLDLTKSFFFFAVVVFLVAMLEAFGADIYLSLLNIRDYYIQKGAMADISINDQNLFASGERPEGRFLIDMPAIHRISSIFLEPVSLGFYAVITAMYFISMKEKISAALYIAALTLCLFLILLSDARMAMIAFVVLLSMRHIFSIVDHRFSVLVLPALLIVSFLIDTFSLLDKTGEGIGYRIFVTIRLLSEADIATAMGLSNFTALKVVDSGLGTILENQGILGILIYWLSPLLFMKKNSPEVRVYTYGVAIYTAFGLLVSPAIFSIKTASLLWFQYGYLIGRDVKGESQTQISEKAFPLSLAKIA